VDPNLPFDNTSRITLIDDVITRDSTMVGMYGRLAEAFPDSEIRCFALVRMSPRLPEIQLTENCFSGTTALPWLPRETGMRMCFPQRGALASVRVVGRFPPMLPFDR